jgi:beta-aspartyl-peptidase (threonine type)
MLKSRINFPLLSCKRRVKLGKTCKPVIVVHRGAGAWDPVHSKPALDAVKEAAKTGFELLETGGTAVDAVVDAVALMEDAGTFNAGCGSALNIKKHMEMKAAVMDGANLQAGAAALLSKFGIPRVWLGW